MKRKEYEDKYDDFSQVYISSPSAKSRRLDPESLVDRVQVPASLQEDHQLRLATDNDERAIVLYNPTNTPLFKSPMVSDFSLVVNSEFIPNLKDHLSNISKQTRIDGSEDKNMAIVPWVGPWAGSQGQTESTEPEEVEMMDMDVEDDQGSQNLQYQQELPQQNWLRPEIFQTNYAPVAW